MATAIPSMMMVTKTEAADALCHDLAAGVAALGPAQPVKAKVDDQHRGPHLARADGMPLLVDSGDRLEIDTVFQLLILQ